MNLYIQFHNISEILCTDADFYVLQSYHPETETSNVFLDERHNTLTTIIKKLIDCILDNGHVLDWAHSEILQLHDFSKEILCKVPTFELLRRVRIFIKKCTRLIPQIAFVHEFDFLGGTK